ncbi:tripartite tricarboxylate transporter permease [Roseateles sp. BYS180W]|uniref:Tripartite tricarboxylate transporter permease n=1 Tax=Roseateles rivi TaxID=3299028 RepID=A0ABW7FXM3_9BURK
MDGLTHLQAGFLTALSAPNLLLAWLGVLLGTLVGVLPGLGPVATMAMLLPALNGLDATSSLILLAGIYYGAQYGGSTTAILINTPGEASSVMTALDGYQMAQQGRAAAALAISAWGSFFAGCVGTLLMAVFAPILAQLAFTFGPAEHFALLTLGLVGAMVLANGAPLKAAAMTLLGLLLAQINTDVISGVARYSLGLPELSDGIGFVVIAMGVFGVGEVLVTLERPLAQRRSVSMIKQDGRLTRDDVREAVPAVLRGTAIGSVLGVLPGGGLLLATFASYALERKWVRNPRHPFGQGAIQGVAGPESANNAAAQTSFIPMLTLGVAPNAVMALLLGVLTLKGIAPGPEVLSTHSTLFWALVASMWIGNAMLLVLNLPLIGLWCRLLLMPYPYLYPAILTFCCIGAYSLSNSSFDVFLVGVFALGGYALRKLDFELAPLMLGYVVGAPLEEKLRQALLLARGDWAYIVSRPMAATFLLTALGLAACATLSRLRKARHPLLAA